MTRVLIYLFPALIDVALGCVLFVAPARMAAEGASASAVTTLATVWALSYMIACRALGFVVREHNAAGWIIAGSLSVAGAAGLFLAFPDPQAMVWLMAPQGVAVAMFFVPFQVFMKAFGGGAKGVVRSTALYTASWSAGMAAGPFVAGWLMTFWTWRATMVLNIVVALATTAGILLLIHLARPTSDDDDPAEQAELNRYAHMPDLAWLAWIGSGAGFVAVAFLRAMMPKVASDMAITEANSGMILATLAITHSLVALGLIGSRTWMYRPLAVAGFGLAGLVGMILFATAQGEAMFFAAAACFGAYSGAFCFYFVFHALVHPANHAKYVAINETVVGATAILGPLAGGWLADKGGFSWPCLAAAGLIACAVLLQGAIHRRSAAAVKAISRR